MHTGLAPNLKLAGAATPTPDTRHPTPGTTLRDLRSDAAAAEAVREQIIGQLSPEDWSPVSQLAMNLDLSHKAVTRHLEQLRRRHLVTLERSHFAWFARLTPYGHDQLRRLHAREVQRAG